MDEFGAPGRLARLREEMTRRGVDLLVLSPGADARWLAPEIQLIGVDRPCLLMVGRDDAALVIVFFEAPPVEQVAPGLPIYPWTDREGPDAAISEAVARFGLGSDATVAVAADLPFRYLAHLLGKLPSGLVDATAVMGPLRLTKSADEIAALGAAGTLLTRAIDHAAEVASVGMTERELEGHIGSFLRMNGAESGEVMVVAAGANAADAHHFADGTVFRPGESVLFDVAARLGNYWSDVTAQVHFGDPSAAYARAYAAVQAAQEAGVQAVQVGRRLGDINDTTNAVLAEHGYGPNGRTGHGIGLDVHEAPSLVPADDLIAPGTVVTIEPGIYIPGSFGIRIEDVVVAEESGPRRLTAAARPLTVKR